VKYLLKWTPMALVVLALILIVGLGAVYALSDVRLGKRYDVGPIMVPIPSDPASVAWGEHLARTRGCTDCHGTDYAGMVVVDDPALGRLVGPNLTAGSGGIGGGYSDLDWVRSIRHGVGPDGRGLLFMPSNEYYFFSDQDLGALIAFLKSLRPMASGFPESSVGPVGRALYLAGKLPLVSAEAINHGAPPPPAPPKGATEAYGHYLAVFCTGCHGAGFSGGPIPGAPPHWPDATNITPDEETGIGRWTEEDFFRALRQGVRPDRSELDPEAMPVRNTALMEDDEIRALWLYLRTLDGKKAGGR
jgi:mono/diheme cytochrome c family protein